jgi:hypothetical protein
MALRPLLPRAHAPGSHVSNSGPSILYVGPGSFLDRPTGAGLRYRLILCGLQQIGDVDVFSYTRDRTNRAGGLALLGRSPLRVFTRMPAVHRTSFARARKEFGVRAGAPWDLVWFAHPSAVVELAPRAA